MSIRHRIANQCFQVLEELENARQRFLAGNDEEALHDIRVHLRILRTILPLVFSRRAKLEQTVLRAFKSLAQSSNPARDLEVLLATLGEHPATEALRQELINHYAILHQRFASGDFEVLTTTAAYLVKQRLQHAGKNGVTPWRQILKLQKRLDLALQHQDFKASAPTDKALLAWHQLRICIKRLRYLHEFALAAPDRAILKRLKAAQQVLGELHDAQNLSRYQHIDFAPLLAQAEAQRHLLCRLS
ncbi:CHAD domain-containing protein [Chitinibacter sp. S2-10]|uniref:CHAD domain-containing protein n=1 Tax=Chitinibacter sp. S2-10 TaxID=3373597 RepID=UPI003977470C